MTADRSYHCHQQAWRQHKSELRAFLAHRCHSVAEADDLLQDVFLKAVQQGQAFCHIENPRAWLFHVARNLLIDRLRLTKATIELPEDLASEDEAETASVDKLSQCLPRVLSELSAEDREAIALCDIDGLSQQDYARRLGLSLPAAKSRVQRARTRLQAQLVKACQVKFDDAGKVCCFTPRAPFTGDSTPAVAEVPAPGQPISSQGTIMQTTFPSEARQNAEDAYSSGLFCAESVLVAVTKARGIESDLIPRLATAFCSGVSRTGGDCGALTGAIMGVSLVLGRSSPGEPVQPVYTATQQVVRTFEAEFGSRHCAALLDGCDLNTPEGQAKFKEERMGQRCRRYTGRAAEIAVNVIAQDTV